MHLVQGVILDFHLGAHTEPRQRNSAENRPEQRGWSASRLGPMEEWFHLVAPGDEGEFSTLGGRLAFLQ